MGEKNQQIGGESRPLGPEERLESWKEICAYLRRDIRTLRRWEKNEGLPVHRHLHNRLPTVYAYKPELDAWWNNRKPRLEQQEQAMARRTRVLRKVAWAAGVAVVLAAATGLGWWWAQRPPLRFAERDWILIADFDNRTDISDFDGTLEHAFVWELSNSRYVNVVPRERIVDTLRLMEQPPDVRVDPSLAREVALRDGGIRALLTGRIEKVDTTYRLDAALVDPTTGARVATFSEEAVGKKDVPAAVRRLSGSVRRALGEKLSLTQESELRLARVTTPSMRALKLYTEGDLLKQNRNPQAAEALFREAIAEDPEFATAHMWLAWALRNQGRPQEEYLPHAERGLQLSAKASERERLFNRASYYIFTEENEKAYAGMEAFLQLYPDDYWATVTMTWLPNKVKRPEVARRYKIKLADLRPNDFRANYLAAEALLTEEDDAQRARPYVQRALHLAALEATSERLPHAHWMAVQLEFLPLRAAWYHGEIQEAYGMLQGFADKVDQYPESMRTSLLSMLGQTYRVFGQLEKADSTCARIADEAYRHSCLGALAFARGDREAYRTHWKHKPPGSWRTIYLAYLGLAAEAQAEIAELEKLGVVPGWNETARALLALRQGNTEAAPQLQRAVRQLFPYNLPASLWGCIALADFYENRGDLDRAIHVLEEADSEVEQNPAQGLAATDFWLELRWRLARVYRAAGREDEAEKIEHDLRRRLAYADPDFPLLRQLNHARGRGARELSSVDPSQAPLP